MKSATVLLSLIACVAGSFSSARAQRPTFDCAKASGDVETLICRDATLAALDLKLATVYAAASAKAKDGLATRLREEQRGWIKERNDCWKATVQTWITATWTVDTVKGCIQAQYELRTSELQAVWQIVPPQTIFYACQNGLAGEVVANYFETDPPTIRLERGDRTKTLWRVGPAGAQKYEGQNVSLVRAADDVRVSWLDTNTGKTDELRCTPR